jgi:hypothetical protein
MAPLAFVIDIPVPAVSVALVNPDPFPIFNCPFAGVVLKPVPPFATGSIPVTLLVRSIEPASMLLVTLPAPIVVASPEVVTSPVSAPGV